MVSKTEKPQKPAFQVALVLFDMGDGEGNGTQVIGSWDAGMAVGDIP